MKLNFSNFFLTNILMFIILILLISLYFELRDEKTQCIANPIQYKIKSLEKNTNSEITCQCSSTKSSNILIVKNNFSYEFNPFFQEKLLNIPSLNHLDLNVSIFP